MRQETLTEHLNYHEHYHHTLPDDDDEALNKVEDDIVGPA